MTNTYKVAIPRLASLEPEAVEKFEERYSELEGVVSPGIFPELVFQKFTFYS